MAINFPNSPTNGQLYSFNEKTWRWSDSYWESYSAQTGYIQGATSVGGGSEILSGTSNNTFYFRTISGGTNVLVTQLDDKILIDTNTNINGDFVNITGDTMTGPLVINSTLNVTGDTTVYSDILPQDDNVSKIGSGVKRFREINVYSGKTTVWEVGSQTRLTSNKVETPELDLGLDSSGNTRSVTANNSIIQDDVLKGGTF